METERLREACDQRPFHPFEIVRADGQRLPVPHPEFISLAPEGSTVVVWKKGAPIWIDIPLITALDFRVIPKRRVRQARRAS